LYILNNSVQESRVGVCFSGLKQGRFIRAYRDVFTRPCKADPNPAKASKLHGVIERLLAVELIRLDSCQLPTANCQLPTVS